MTATPAPSVAPQPASAPECRNCGATAPGIYCPNCGQETSLALPTVRAMLREAAGRYVALDGRLWRTLSGLLFHPGLLTREYFAGRRRRYVRPGRLFLVLSIGLFALLRFEGKPPQFVDSDLTRAERDRVAREVADATHPGLSIDSDLGVHMSGGTGLNELAGGPWLDPVRRRAELFNRLTRQEKADQIFAGLMRYGPYAMFALLPLFALLLKLVYLGRARRYPARPRRYAAHLVFGAHNHAFLILAAALFVLLPNGRLQTALIIWVIIYLLQSLRAVYGGPWSGVLARAAVIAFVYAVFFAFVVVGLVIVAILVR